jgi:predicted TIM-barrel fold metal-dependent hydrolase
VVVNTPIIDFHFHVTTASEYSEWFIGWLEVYGGEATLAHLRQVLSSPQAILEYLDEQGVDYAVALAETNPLTTGTSPNERVAELCRSSDRLIPFANINPYVTADLAGELRHCVNDLGCRGLKLYPTYQHFYVNDARLYPLYDEAQRLSIPIMVHTGSSVFRGARLKYGDPLYVDDVVVDFPELTMIMAHSGRGFWYEAAFFMAQLHRNVYMEITGLPPLKLPAYFPNLERNADKIIFGSDWPSLTDIRGNIAAVRSLELSEESKAKILGGNAARVLGLLK